MMNLLEILYNQYPTKTKFYVTWDAVAWHNSSSLLEALDQFNEQTRNCLVGPIIELVPLPISAQFLNVIEGVSQRDDQDSHQQFRLPVTFGNEAGDFKSLQR